MKFISLNKLNDKHSHKCMFPYKKHRKSWTSNWFHSDLVWCDSYNWSKNFKKIPVTNINLTNYNYKYCPTESPTGGTLLYILNHLSYKPRNDLCIYKTAELESTFIKLINTKKSNVIISTIYRHPNMDLNQFNDIYLILY